MEKDWQFWAVLGACCAGVAAGQGLAAAIVVSAMRQHQDPITWLVPNICVFLVFMGAMFGIAYHLKYRQEHPG